MLAWRHVRALRDPRHGTPGCTGSPSAPATGWRRRTGAGRWSSSTSCPTGSPRPLRLSAHVAERDRLGRELGRLPVDQRTVMVLHFYLDLPLTDVADILDIPVGTAKSRLHRGLATLRSAMATDRSELRLVGSDRHESADVARADGRRLDGRGGRRRNPGSRG